MMKKIGYRFVAAAVAAVLCICSSGCRMGDEEVTISRGMSDQEVFVIDGNVCTLPMMKLLLMNNICTARAMALIFCKMRI